MAVWDFGVFLFRIAGFGNLFSRIPAFKVLYTRACLKRRLLPGKVGAPEHIRIPQ